MKKVLFVHVPKTAGNSFHNVFKHRFKKENYMPLGHYSLSAALAKNEDYKNWFKVATTRNPFNRLVSNYFWFRKIRRAALKEEIERYNNCTYFLENFDKFYSKYVKEHENNFYEFCLEHPNNWVGSSEPLPPFIHFLPQYCFICDKNYNILTDFLCKFENLRTDLYEMMKERIRLPHINSAPHKNFETYYSLLAKNKVQEIYQKDIELFY